MAGQVLSYNGHSFQEDTCYFTIKRTGILGGTNRINMVRNVWDIQGYVRADRGQTTAASIAQVSALSLAVESAVRDGGDLVFSLNPASASLISTQCASGTHVGRMIWTTGWDGVRGNGAEGVLRRTFSLMIYGDIVVTSTDTLITQYRDSITAIGSGLARIKPVTSINGGVQAQQTVANTAFHCIQQGHAEGLLDYPTPPNPIYQFVSGVYYDSERMKIERYTPKSWGINQNTGFGIRWSYPCWASFNLGVNPGTF